MLTLRQCWHCSRQLTHLLLPVLAVLHLQLSLQRVSLRLQLPLLLRLLPPLLLPLLPLQPLLLLDLSLDGRLRKEETGTDIIPSFVVSGHFSHLLPPPVGGSFFISPQPPPPPPHKVWGRWRDNNITYGAPSRVLTKITYDIIPLFLHPANFYLLSCFSPAFNADRAR